MTEESSPLPNFLIVGTAKAGTTSLWHWLRGHPQVFMSDPQKEPYYFLFGEEENEFQFRDWRGAIPGCATDWDEYRRLFRDAGNAKAIGEATVYYLWHRTAPEKIARRLGQPKIITILRDPIARGYSHYTYNRMRRVEGADSFAEAVRLERELTNPYCGIAYLGLGMYAQMLERYFATFGRDNVLVLLFEDLAEDREGTLAKVYNFLDIAPNYEPPDEIRNVTLRENAITNALYQLKASDSAVGRFVRRAGGTLAKSDLYIRLKGWVVQAALELAGKGAGKPDKLDAATRARLLPLVRDDIVRVEALIGRDLSAWRR